MAENETPEQPVDDVAAADPIDLTMQVPATAPAPATPQPRLRDHLFSFRSVVAVGVATLLLGGAGGAALVAVTDDDHHEGPRIVRFGDGPGRDGGGSPFQRGPRS